MSPSAIADGHQNRHAGYALPPRGEDHPVRTHIASSEDDVDHFSGTPLPGEFTGVVDKRTVPAFLLGGLAREAHPRHHAITVQSGGTAEDSDLSLFAIAQDKNRDRGARSDGLGPLRPCAPSSTG